MPPQSTTRDRPGRPGRTAALTTATVLCLLVGSYGLALVGSGFRLLPDDIAANALPLAVKIHVAFASIALVLVPWQLWPSLRARVPRVHRWTGRAYVVAALVGGLSGTAAATTTTHGPVAGAGFATLGVLWTTITLAAFLAARRGDFVQHRRWAVRSFVLAFAAVTLRLYLALSGLAGIDFEVAYASAAWLSWAPQLLLAERFLRRPTRVSQHPPAATARASREVTAG